MRAPAFWDDSTGRFSLAATALTPAAWVYAAAHRLRWRLTRPARAPIPVVCVGNLVAGGAGKTPVALAIAAYMRGKGATPHFLSRGYGGSASGPLRVDGSRHTEKEVGDEALLLAAAAPTWIARDRAAGAELAAASGATAVILDDGFQNPGLTKDVSLVVVDGTYGLGNGRTLPAGPLRESIAFGMQRASALVVVGGETPPVAPGAVPVLHAALLPTVDARARLAGARVVAFAGIGRPAKFFETLESIGCTVVTRCNFPDHHRYRPSEITRLRAEAYAANARLVTTTKDWMRLADRAGIDVLDVTLEFADTAVLDRVLSAALPR